MRHYHLIVVALAILLLGTHPGDSFHLQIENENLLLQRKTGKLVVNLDFIDHPVVTSADVLHGAQISMALNGSICERFPGALSDIEFIVSAKCLHSDSFWFSVVIELSTGTTLSSTAVFVPREEISVATDDLVGMTDQITLVLPLVLDDIPRSFILLNSLVVLDNKLVKEMMIFSPSREIAAVETLLEGAISRLPFPVTVLTDSVLLGGIDLSTTYPYAVQMALKLLAHSLISTRFYLTLDSDVILLRPFEYGDIVDSKGRAIYHHENRSEVYGWWWEGSEKVLGLRDEFSARRRRDQGFGVTPAILSTAGAQLTFRLLAEAAMRNISSGYRIDEMKSLGKGEVLKWLLNDTGENGIVWNEYTLYALSLLFFEVTYNDCDKCILFHVYLLYNFLRYLIIIMLLKYIRWATLISKLDVVFTVMMCECVMISHGTVRQRLKAIAFFLL